jgi:hypothetical protein
MTCVARLTLLQQHDQRCRVDPGLISSTDGRVVPERWHRASRLAPPQARGLHHDRRMPIGCVAMARSMPRRARLKR